jgi:hypothetical protein
MRVIFLILTFCSFILTVQAQRTFKVYTCQVSHKQNETVFYLPLNEVKNFEICGWQMVAGLRRIENQIEVSLKRIVTVMDADYQKEARMKYPLNARVLPVTLEHDFGGRTDIFTMICSPRDP